MSNFLSNFTSDNYQNKKNLKIKKSSDLVDGQAIGQQEASEALHKKQVDENTGEAKQVTPGEKTVASPTYKEMAKPVSDDLLVKDTAFAKETVKTSLFWYRHSIDFGVKHFGFYYNQTHIKYLILLVNQSVQHKRGPINIR